MRASLAGSLAVAAIVAATLVGCAPPDDPQPSPSSSPTESAPITEEELLAEARATYESYLAIVAQMQAEQDAAPSRLAEVANDVIATETARDVQAALDQGILVDGVPKVTVMQLDPGSNDAQVSVTTCLSSENVVISTSQGEPLPPAGGEGVTRWRIVYERVGEGAALRMTEYDPLPESSMTCSNN